jgi:hypothetical protein
MTKRDFAPVAFGGSVVHSELAEAHEAMKPGEEDGCEQESVMGGSVRYAPCNLEDILWEEW